jgi:hypothetical protein
VLVTPVGSFTQTGACEAELKGGVQGLLCNSIWNGVQSCGRVKSPGCGGGLRWWNGQERAEVRGREERREGEEGRTEWERARAREEMEASTSSAMIAPDVGD